MKAQIGNLMRQAQEMQAKMKQAQEELASLEVIGESGGGMVKVAMNCKHEVRRVELEPELPTDDREMLEDLIAAAINDACRKVEQASQEKMSGLTGGLNLPPGMNLPF